jgi:hypothetical protein
MPHHRDADSHGGGARCRAAHHRRADPHYHYPPYAYLGNGYLLGVPFAAVLAVLVPAARRADADAVGLFIRAIGINPVARTPARARPITLALYAFCGLTAVPPAHRSNVKSADATTPEIFSSSTPFSR